MTEILISETVVESAAQFSELRVDAVPHTYDLEVGASHLGL